MTRTGSRDEIAAAFVLAARAELPLVFVHVAPDEPRLSWRDPERKRRLGESVSVGIELLERATARVAGSRGATTRVALGDPAEQLAAVAASTQAELVIVGSRGRRRLGARLLGSV
jgi:nucleotide-binding universal stress UspA family protein